MTASTITELYQDIYGELDVAGFVWNESDSKRISASIRLGGKGGLFTGSQDELWGRVFSRLLDKYTTVLQEFAYDPNVRGYIRLLANQPAFCLIEDDIAAIARASVAFTGLSLITTPQALHWMEDDTFSVPAHLVYLLHKFRPLIRRGLCLVVPSSFALKAEDGFFTVSRVLAEDTALSSHRPLMALDPERLVKSACQEVSFRTGLPAIGVPTLEGLSLADLISIREDNQGSFALFQHGLQKLLDACQPEASMPDLSGALGEISAGVIKCEEDYREIVRRLQWRGLDVGIGLTGMALALAGPAEWKACVAAVFGSKTLYEGIRWFLAKNSTDREMRSSEYWFPWYLARKSGDLEGMS